MRINKTPRAAGKMSGPYRVVDLHDAAGSALRQLPWSFRILLENVLRCRPADEAERATAEILGWLASGSSIAEIAFSPARLLMHDTTCVPALVDIAAMREALAQAGADPTRLNPGVRVDVSVDHSIAVDHFGVASAVELNMKRELERNAERFRLMKWATRAVTGLHVHPPGTGIIHTFNLEQLATVVTALVTDGRLTAFPDTLIATDSHTPMINGIGVLGWGVGGLEAESVLLGMPVMMQVPEIIGVRLTGRLPEGTLATDLALTVTERLRRYGVSGQFVEFFGPGLGSLSAGDRCVVANMAPEYGATTAYFPIDQRTLDYLAATGRHPSQISLVSDYAKTQALWFDPDAEPRYTDVVEIDLSAIGVSIAGPHRPQDRLSPAATRAAIGPLLAERGPRTAPPASGEPGDGAVAIAAITSCTNTSDPRLLVAAGLLAQKARRLGLAPPPWVKTSLSPGSPAAERYLRRAGLLPDLEAIGFGIVGYGCMTCIGNSGPLTRIMDDAVESKGTLPVAVLSGNRNFSGRVHPQVDASFLASPPLVVAYALAGDVDRDILSDPIGRAADGSDVRLADLWPSGVEIDDALAKAVDREDFAGAFQEAEKSEVWRVLDAPGTPLFPWDESSTYIRRPPFASLSEPRRLGRYSAFPLIVVGDDVTTDQISPAGAIPPGSDAGRYLVAQGQPLGDLNVFASRRGNWQVMLRGLFTNRAVRNMLDERARPGETVHGPSGEIMPLWRAADRYGAAARSVVLVAGERYGAGSSRDWAAKGVSLLGIRAVLAQSFERIHRQNLIGMGILPLVMPPAAHPQLLGITALDQLDIDAPEDALTADGAVQVTLRRQSGETTAFVARAAVKTALELELLRHGGVIPFILRRTLETKPVREPDVSEPQKARSPAPGTV